MMKTSREVLLHLLDMKASDIENKPHSRPHYMRLQIYVYMYR
jgi:hypothetical protein